MTNLLLQLRDTARAERDKLIRLQMTNGADSLQAALKALAETPTGAALIAVNGCWAHCTRLLGFASPPAGGGGGGHLKEGAELSERAA